jgi:two-component sensor histidine kinase
LPWAVLAPLIFRLVGRLPLDRDRWKIAIPVHLLCCVGAVALCNWWAENIFPPRFFRGPGGREGRERYISRRASEGRSGSNAPQAPASGTLSELLRDGAAPAPDAARPTARPDGAPPPPRSGRSSQGGRSGFGGPRRGRPSFNAFFVIGFRLPVYIALISAAHAMHFYRRSKERERRSLELEANLVKSRLQALTMQLQPHFLFNALNAIAALVHSNPDAADEMLAALSDLLRLTLETSREHELPLRRELEFVERYLLIEHVRFGDRLQFELDVAPETEAALVPTFLLQPLVENAVRHGLEPRSGNGKLVIRARRENGSLRLSVEDNGVGLSEEKSAREGIGLANTRARLHELYDGAAHMELCNRDGLTVELTLPFRVGKSETLKG